MDSALVGFPIAPEVKLVCGKSGSNELEYGEGYASGIDVLEYLANSLARRAFIHGYYRKSI